MTDPNTAINDAQDSVTSHEGILIVDDNEQNLELLQAYLDEMEAPSASPMTGSKPSNQSRSPPPTSSCSTS